MTVSIAHLSDPHITTGALAHAPALALSRALGRVLTLDPRPDCVVITGDLVDRGQPEEYAALKEIVGRFPMPLHLVVGNHDVPAALLAEFGGDRAHYSVDYPGFTFVALASTVPGRPDGELGPDQLAWLDQTLAVRPDIPAVVCVHHPPIPVGMPYLDGMRLADGDALGAVVSRHRNVVRVLCGHVHRSIVSEFAGTVLATAPSTYLQSDVRFREGESNYAPEPTSFLLHLQTEASWVTHTVAVSHGAAAIAGF